MAITISSATNTELEVLYHAIGNLAAEPKPIDIQNAWLATLNSLMVQIKAQLVSSGYTPKHWGGNEKS